jgi:hypothetical protein
MCAQEKPKRVVHLNGNAVIRPILKSIRDSSDAVAFGLSAINETDPKNVPPVSGLFVQITHTAPEEEEADDRRATLQQWIIYRGITEIARSIRESLESAHIFIELVKAAPEMKTGGRFNEVREAAQISADRARFPELVEMVREGLAKEMGFHEELNSMQKIRNCLEHRNGFVAERDVDEAGELRLTFPIWVLTVRHNGNDEEHELDQPVFVPEGGEVLLRRTSMEKVFRLQEKIQFSPKEFMQIAFSCYFFATDIGTKLPTY